MIMTILITPPRCDLVESAFGHVCTNTGRTYAIHKYKHSLKDGLTQSSSVPKLIESESLISTQSVKSMKRCRGVNRKHASAEGGIWNLAFKHHRKI